MPSRKCVLLGKWRITEMELWDTAFVDMLEPAYIIFEPKGGGEFIFGAVRGDLECRYRPDGVRFTWEGFDEMEPAFGAGSAELALEASLSGEIHFHGGDEATFKARRW